LHLSGKKEIKDESASGEKTQSLWVATFIGIVADCELERSSDGQSETITQSNNDPA
jgi:hypothetical protein